MKAEEPEPFVKRNILLLYFFCFTCEATRLIPLFMALKMSPPDWVLSNWVRLSC